MHQFSKLSSIPGLDSAQPLVILPKPTLTPGCLNKERTCDKKELADASRNWVQSKRNPNPGPSHKLSSFRKEGEANTIRATLTSQTHQICPRPELIQPLVITSSPPLSARNLHNVHRFSTNPVSPGCHDNSMRISHPYRPSMTAGIGSRKLLVESTQSAAIAVRCTTQEFFAMQKGSCTSGRDQPPIDPTTEMKSAPRSHYTYTGNMAISRLVASAYLCLRSTGIPPEHNSFCIGLGRMDLLLLAAIP